jgi:hypothetical protein
MKCAHIEEGKDILREIQVRALVATTRHHTHTSWESIQIRVLLADSFGRCRRPHSLMYQLPVLRQGNSHPDAQP